MAEDARPTSGDPLPLCRVEESQQPAVAPVPYDAHYFLRQIASGVGIAGGVYPFAVCAMAFLLMTLWAIFTGNLSPSHAANAVSLLPSVALMATLGGMVAAITACLFSIFVVCVVWAGIRLLDLNVSWPALGTLCGGVTGFLFLAPVAYFDVVRLISPPLGFTRDLGSHLMLFTLGPMLAIFLGQVGGAFGGCNAVWFLVDKPTVTGHPKKQRFSFSIRQLLVLTVLVSVLMALLRVTGLLTPAMLVLVSGWLVWQTISRRPAMWLGEKLSRRRRRGSFFQCPATPTAEIDSEG